MQLGFFQKGRLNTRAALSPAKTDPPCGKKRFPAERETREPRKGFIPWRTGEPAAGFLLFSNDQIKRTELTYGIF